MEHLPDRSVVLVVANPQLYMSNDIPYVCIVILQLVATAHDVYSYLFRQNTDFLYLTGFQEPESALMLGMCCIDGKTFLCARVCIRGEKERERERERAAR